MSLERREIVVKVISGILKGRNILGYDINGTRPTMDRVKESVFATIQNHIKDATVLDLFAGSGNYGIEAYSNGASSIYLNDCNKKCLEVIKKNLINFNVYSSFQLLNLDYMKCLNYLKDKGIKFDLIFLDPPYKMDVCEKILTFLNEHCMLNDKALVICEVTNNNLLNEYGCLNLLKTKKYGEKYVFIYQNSL